MALTTVGGCAPASDDNRGDDDPPLVATRTDELSGPPATLGSYALLARTSVTIGDRSIVSGGSVGVAAAAPGCAPGLVSAGTKTTISIGKAVRVQKAVIGAQSRVGDLFADQVQLGSGVVTGARASFSPPPDPPLPGPVVAGSAAVTVARGQTSTLAPGRYGAVTVNGTMHLAGGLYELKSLRVGSNARVNAQARATVRLATGLAGEDGAQLTIAAGLTASDLYVVAAGVIDGGGNSVTLGCNTRLTAVVVARDAFRASHHLNVTGAIAASQIFLGPDTQATLAGGFSCNDGGGCGPGDACSSFSCVAGQCQRSNVADGTACGAGDACSRLSCAAGQCQRSNVADGTTCDDQNVCTQGDRCQTGACAPGASIVTRYATGLAQPTALTPGPDGNLWFISPESQAGAYDGRVGRIVPATGAVSVFPTARRLLDIKAGPDGNLWLAERLPAPGGELSALGRLTPAGLFLDELVGLPADKIAAGPDGNQWFVSAIGDANIAGGIRPVDGLLVAILFVSNTARHMTGGPDGNVWVTESNGGLAPALIGRIAPDSTLTEFPVSTSGDLNVIATGPDGNLWFTDEGDNQIGRITPAGVVTKFPLPIGASAPHGITTGPDGNLWFTERNSNRIGRITVGGNITELACLPSASSGPTSIAAGADGRMWLTESATGNVVGIRIP